MRSACSELPNDNPMLHEGTAWVPMTPTGRPRAVARPPTSERPPASEAERATKAPAEVPDAFAQLVGLLGKVALGAGATRAAAVLPGYLAGQVIERAALGDATSAALLGSGHAREEAGGLVMSETVATTARAWRAVLSGQSGDLSGCDETLDTWCAELLSALSGAPSRANELRRELRRFGVAAFGLLAQAA